ncbi:MAG: hypothetical protein HOO95_07700 [Gallionella sp.]|nr:hypothetical protein [Gallionella sp.]
MNFLNDLKTTFAKERHAELIIASGGAILIAALASILDPDTLKLLDALGPMPSNLAKVLVWGATILAGALLIYIGLRCIDAERAAIITQSIVPPPVMPTSEITKVEVTQAVNNSSEPMIPHFDTASLLAIQIKHGNTHISINIQSEKNNTQ